MFNEQPGLESIDVKVSEFSSAIEKYNTFALYMRFETFLAIIVVTFQLLSMVNLVHNYHHQGGFLFIITIFLAYFATDFINGLVHMIVDNNANYSSIVGPFIAAFHMHHYKRKYTEQHALKIYFTESGHKFWLVVYLILLVTLQKKFKIEPNLNLGLVAFGIFASIAELSHYWCHNAAKSNPLIIFLQKYHVLLSIRHHRIHHTHDNLNYAFLNGMSDPLLNVIARKFFKGYKNNTDLHVSTYIKSLGQNVPV